MKPEALRAAFQARFHHPAQVVARAPGRVNLIGEHTDYNDGYVLPIAVPQSTWVAAAARDELSGATGGELRVHSVNLDETQVWPIDAWCGRSLPHWTSYVAGVTALLRQRGMPPRCIDLLIHSEVPVGAGLSSSAALTVAVGTALTALAAMTLSLPELAALCRAAEHGFAGVPCGVMDQYAALASRVGMALLLDCRSLVYEHVLLPLGEHTFLVVDSGVRHELAVSEYARRQAQCAQALAFLQRFQPSAKALRDVDATAVSAHAAEMGRVAAARARHVTSENERTLAAAEALRHGDLVEMGRLMLASHCSLRDDYEVSCAELDQLVEIASATPGVLGARLTGGGFGGCVVVLARTDAFGCVEQALRERYDTAERRARVLAVRPSAGASLAYP